MAFQANVLIFAGGRSAREFVPVDAYWLPASLVLMGSLFLRVCGSGTSAYAVPLYFFIVITCYSGVVNTKTNVAGALAVPHYRKPGSKGACSALSTFRPGELALLRKFLSYTVHPSPLYFLAACTTSDAYAKKSCVRVGCC